MLAPIANNQQLPPAKLTSTPHQTHQPTHHNLKPSLDLAKSEVATEAGTVVHATWRQGSWDAKEDQ